MTFLCKLQQSYIQNSWRHYMDDLFLQALFGVKNDRFSNAYFLQKSLKIYTWWNIVYATILTIQRNKIIFMFEIMLVKNLKQTNFIHSCSGAISKKSEIFDAEMIFGMIIVNARLQKICARDNIFCRLNFLWYVSNCFWHIKDHVPPPSGVCFALLRNN